MYSKAGSERLLGGVVRHHKVQLYTFVHADWTALCVSLRCTSVCKRRVQALEQIVRRNRALKGANQALSGANRDLFGVNRALRRGLWIM